MLYIFMLLLGMVGGGGCVFVYTLQKWKEMRQDAARRIAHKEELRSAAARLKEREQQLAARTEQSQEREALFEQTIVSYRDLEGENKLLKTDVRNLDIAQRKLQLDVALQGKRQDELDTRAGELGRRYLKENVKTISESINANNFTACKQRLLDVIGRCRGIGLAVSGAEEATLLSDLKAEFEMAVRASLEREEQARIKAQIREEQKLQREIDRELKQSERERTAISAALDQALARAKGEHTAEVESLRARLAEAEAKSQRAISRAQMTKAGYVYVISNIGSFGDQVFKVGMTRRLEPDERVRELGDASVPFPFDVHMMISCDNAPALENSLHRALHKHQVNKTNPRKEFFKTDIHTIARIVEENHCKVEYLADAHALEYRQSLTMSDSDLEYIESVYDAAEDDGESVPDGS